MADSVRPNQRRRYTSFVRRSPFSRPGPTAGGLHLPISVAGKDRAQPESAGRSVSRGYRDGPAHTCATGVHWGSWLCAGSAAPAVESSRSPVHHSWARGHARRVPGPDLQVGPVAWLGSPRHPLSPSALSSARARPRRCGGVSRSGIPGALVAIGSQSEQRTVAGSHGSGFVPRTHASRAEFPGLQNSLGATGPASESEHRRTHRPPAARLYHGLLLGIATGSFTGTGKTSPRFPDSPSTPAPRKLSSLECALRGAGHVVAPALERTGPGAT